MSFYILLYLIVIIFSIIIWKYYFNLSSRKSRNIFIMIFNISTSFWFLFYFLSYHFFDNLYYILISIKVTYFLWILSVYSIFFYLHYYFRKKITNIEKIKILLLFLVFFIIYIYSDLIINWLEYDFLSNDYYEIFWKWVFLHLILNLIFIYYLLYKTIKNYKLIFLIDKIRFNYLFFWIYIFLFSWIILQFIIPLINWKYFLEKEIVLFFIPYLLLSFYSLNRYTFTDFSIRYKEIASILLSWILSLFFIHITKYLGSFLSNDFLNFWWYKSDITYVDLWFWIILFYIFYNIFSWIIPWNKDYKSLIDFIYKLQNQVKYVTDVDWVNNLISSSLKSKYNIKYVKASCLKSNSNSALIEYFLKFNTSFFLNDIVFIEENKHKFDIEAINKEINKKSYLIFPIKNTSWEIIGIFEIWKKSLSEPYYNEEIDIIKWFVEFLWWHFKYIEMHKEIYELNVNLDKELDKVSSDYNELLNKQKDFISVISHEIKTPVMSSTMQIESIIDDIEDDNIDLNNLKSELDILKDQFYKISDLTKVLFDKQRLESGKVELHLEITNLEDLIIFEINNFKQSEKQIDFVFNFWFEKLYINLDKVQFSQVIRNIIWNAVKFASKDYKKVIIEVYADENGDIVIDITDNGKWFVYWENEFIFEKYNNGKWKTIWLWLGLFLCKNITEMHGWKIMALNSDRKLYWALIRIVLPKNLKKDI